jgi:hypothetical protein
MARKRTAAIAAFVPPSGDEALDDWFAPLRTAAIARILKAVAKSTDEVQVANDDEVKLATDVFEAYAASPSKLDPQEGSKAAQRLQKVREILKAVEKQTALISADPYLSKVIGDAAGIKQPFDIWGLRNELRSLEIQLSLSAERWRREKDLAPDVGNRRPSEREWLAGVALPLVYERHFLSPAGRSRNAEGEPGGPAVRFVEATMNELGIPYSAESIVRAFTRLKQQRVEERARKPHEPSGKN